MNYELIGSCCAAFCLSVCKMDAWERRGFWLLPPALCVMLVKDGFLTGYAVFAE